MSIQPIPPVSPNLTYAGVLADRATKNDQALAAWLGDHDGRIDDLESRSGTSVAGSVATFGDLPSGPALGQSWIVRERAGHPVPHPALYTWSETLSDWSSPVSVQGAATDAAVAAVITQPATQAALTTEATAQAITGAAFFTRRPGAGPLTQGDVITLGAFAHHLRTDAGTSLVLGGGSSGQENVVGGNLANVDTGTSNLAGAPTLTGENGNWNFILGGYDTVVNGWANIIHGYHSQVAADANHCTFGGGSRIKAAAGTAYGTVGGGTLNEISGNNPTVAGGNNNKATNNGTSVGGGQSNTASGNAATISGGTTNTASGANSSILGGSQNTASGNSAMVVGGLLNTATGTAAAAIGRENTAGGNNSLATGRGAVAREEAHHAHAATPFTTPGDAQISRWSLKRQSTDATAGHLEAITGQPPTIPENTTWAFTALVVARRADVDGENAAWEVKGCFKRDGGNTAAFVGTPTVTSLGASAGAAAWTVGAASFSAGTFRLVATGEAGKTIRWVAELRASEASG